MSNYSMIFGLMHAIFPHHPWASQGIILFCIEEKTNKETKNTTRKNHQNKSNKPLAKNMVVLPCDGKLSFAAHYWSPGSPNLFSVRHKDTNHISAKPVTARGVAFTLALPPACRIPAWCDKARAAPRADTQLATTSDHHGSDTCSIWTTDGSWSHLTLQMHLYSKNLL